MAPPVIKHSPMVPPVIKPRCKGGTVMNDDGKCVCKKGAEMRDGSGGKCVCKRGSEMSDSGKCKCKRGYYQKKFFGIPIGNCLKKNKKVLNSPTAPPVIKHSPMAPPVIKHSPMAPPVIKHSPMVPPVVKPRCKGGTVMNDDGKCVCKKGAEMRDGSGGKCVCKRGSEMSDSGKCKCKRGYYQKKFFGIPIGNCLKKKNKKVLNSPTA